MDPEYTYQLIRSKKRTKTLSLHIKADGKISVRVPYRTPEWEIKKFIEKRHSWILQQLGIREKSAKPTKLRFRAGEKFSYLGESYPLEIDALPHPGRELKLLFGRFILSDDQLVQAKEHFIRWYKAEAQITLPERLDYYSTKLRLFPNGIRITGAKSRWGSCSPDDRLSFSWRIMMLPLEIIDYILVHELVHIQVKNHSRTFWNYLESILPDCQRHRRWLREHESELAL